MAKAGKKPASAGHFIGRPDDLREWQARMGFTFDQARLQLDMSISAYAEMLNGNSKINLRTALACAAIEHGIPPLGKK